MLSSHFCSLRKIIAALTVLNMVAISGVKPLLFLWSASAGMLVKKYIRIKYI
jgi:hypothetical protein